MPLPLRRKIQEMLRKSRRPGAKQGRVNRFHPSNSTRHRPRTPEVCPANAPLVMMMVIVVIVVIVVMMGAIHRNHATGTRDRTASVLELNRRVVHVETIP